jgi:hypothetical protein
MLRMGDGNEVAQLYSSDWVKFALSNPWRASDHTCNQLTLKFLIISEKLHTW